MSRAVATLTAERFQDDKSVGQSRNASDTSTTAVGLVEGRYRRRRSELPAVASTRSRAVPARPLSDRWGESITQRLNRLSTDVEGVSDGELVLSIDNPASRINLLEAGYLATKRLMDITVAALGLAALLPVWGVIAIVQLLSDRGPLLYVHTRVGQRGREFACYKLRSMRVGADRIKVDLLNESHHDDPRSFKMKQDPRVTRLGRFLRRSSLDETPQLINVLLGQMSLVGPRPSLPIEVAQYTLDEMDRLDVKPGLTCIWQVSGRSNVPFPEQLEMDRDYIRRRSTFLDIRLLAATVRAVISADGAY